MNSVSVSMTAVWKIKFGQNATIAADTRPIRLSTSRRPTSNVNATVPTPSTRLNSAAAVGMFSGRCARRTSHTTAPSAAGYPTG
jgi:hypothetical protein